MQKPRIPPHPTTKQEILFLRRMGFPAQKKMNERARACYTVHRGACEDWTHGEPVEVWRDENHILCIRYADGKWWHYSFKPTGLEWW